MNNKINKTHQNSLITFIETKVHGRRFVLKMKSRLQKLSEMKKFTLQQLIAKKASPFSLACLPFIFNDKKTKKKVMMKLLKNQNNKLTFQILKSIFSPIISMSFLNNEIVLNYFKEAGNEDLKVFSMLLEKFYKKGNKTISLINNSINSTIIKDKAKALFKPEECPLSKVALNKITMKRFNESRRRQKIKSLKTLLEKSSKLDDLTKEETASLKNVLDEYVKKIDNNKLASVIRSYFDDQARLEKKFSVTNDINFFENEYKSFNDVNYIIKKYSGGFMSSIIKSLMHVREFRRGRDTTRNELKGDLFLPAEKARNALLFMTKMWDTPNRKFARLLESDSNYVIFSSWIVELTGFYYQNVISSIKNGHSLEHFKKTGTTESVVPECKSISNTKVFMDKTSKFVKWLAERFDLNSDWLLLLKELLLKNMSRGGNKKELETFFKLYKQEKSHVWKFYEQNGVTIYEMIPQELIRQWPFTNLNKLKEDSKYEEEHPGYLTKYLQFRFKTKIQSFKSYSEKWNSNIRYLSTKDKRINEIAIEYLKTSLIDSLKDLEGGQQSQVIAKALSTMYQVNYCQAKKFIPDFLSKIKFYKMSVANTTNLKMKKTEISDGLRLKKIAISIIKFLVDNLERLNILKWDFLQLILKQFGYSNISLKSKIVINSILKKNNLRLNEKKFLLNLIERQNSLFSYFLKKKETYKTIRTSLDTDPIKNLVSIFVKIPSLSERTEMKEIKKLRSMKVQQNELTIASIKTVNLDELKNIGIDYI